MFVRLDGVLRLDRQAALLQVAARLDPDATMPLPFAVDRDSSVHARLSSDPPAQLV
jgi:hypothetical protein